MANELVLTIKTVAEGRGAEQTEQQLSGISKAVSAAGAALVSFASIETAKAAFELAELGAQAMRTESAFMAISGSAGDAAANLEAIQRATRGAITDTEAMAAANRLMQMGLATNAEELERVTTLAVRLGTAMGRTASASIEEFALLLANQSIPRLDTFGISAGKVRERIAELQAQTPGLSREVAFMTATFEQGDIAMARLGESTEDMALSFEQMEASVGNLKESAGRLLATFGVDMVREVTAATDALNENFNAVELLLLLTPAAGLEIRRLKQRFAEGVESSQTFAESLEEDRMQLLELRAASDSAGASSLTFTEQMALIAAEADGAAASTGDLADATNASAEAAGAAAEASRDWIGALEDFEIDNEQIWQMAAASGASATELANLAQMLGIANETQIVAAISAQTLTDQFGAGTITAEQYNAQMQLLALGLDGTVVGTTAMTDAMGQADPAIAAMRERAAYAQLGIEDLTSAMIAIPDIRRTIEIKTEFTGAPPPPGLYGAFDASIPGRQAGGTAAGLTWVGEGGAEPVILPFGSRVVSHSEANRVMNDNRRIGGDTINVFAADSGVAAMLAEQQRNRRIQQLTR